MKNQVASGMIALSLMAPATSIANETKVLDLDNLEILTSGQVQINGYETEVSVMPSEGVLTAGINIGSCGSTTNNGCTRA